MPLVTTDEIMPTDTDGVARTHAILHLIEAFKANGQDFAAYLEANPEEAEKMIAEVIATEDEDLEPEPTDEEIDAMPGCEPVGKGGK